MAGAITRGLGNISVRAKLTLGFATVLVLTVLIALTGWQGLASLSERGDKLISISILNEKARDMRIARLSYALKPDSEHAGAVIRAIDAADRHIDEVKAQLETPESLRWVAQADRAWTSTGRISTTSPKPLAPRALKTGHVRQRAA